VQAAVDWDADGLCVESDYGRDMPLAVVSNALRRVGLQIPVRPAVAGAIGNKRARAFPVAQLAAQGRYPHRGVHEALEDQVCTWTEADDNSPDRMDAMVWPAWQVGLVTKTFTGMASMPAPASAARSISPYHRR
jgi:phage terminase large subunit-like protein